jgi:uncharacterized protein YidB (DUF937 family)
MANPFLGQILGSVIGNAMSQRGRTPLGGGIGGPGSGGGLGDLLGSVMAGGTRGGIPMGLPGGMGGAAGMGRGGGRMGDQRNLMLAMLLPLAMQWVQRNGGIGSVLQRFRQQGHAQQAASWVGTGANEAIDPSAVGEVVGRQELSRLSQELGVGEEEVAGGFAEILPEMVDHLSPQGEVPPEADEVLGGGLVDLQRTLGGFR